MIDEKDFKERLDVRLNRVADCSATPPDVASKNAL